MDINFNSTTELVTTMQSLLKSIIEDGSIGTETVSDWKEIFSLSETEEEKTALYYQAAIQFPDKLIFILAAYHGREEIIINPKVTIMQIKETGEIAKVKTPRKSNLNKTPRVTKMYTLVNVETGEEIEVTGKMLTKPDSPIGQLTKSMKDTVIYYGRPVNGWKNKEGKLL